MKSKRSDAAYVNVVTPCGQILLTTEQTSSLSRVMIVESRGSTVVNPLHANLILISQQEHGASSDTIHCG